MKPFNKIRQLSEEQRFYWLQLIRSANVGSVVFWNLLRNYRSAKAALEALPNLVPKSAKKPIKIANPKDIEQEIKQAKKLGIRFVCAGEEDYPTFLQHTDCAPPIVAIRGNSEAFKKTGVSIVGSRNASAVGQKLAYSFAYDLSEAGFAIVSGFARGIDTAAHQGSLPQNRIGVLAGGVDIIYPPENKKFYHEILDKGGVFISEMPVSFRPRACDFPRRNRLIVGLSLAVIVVEAAKHSGSLTTASFANDMGRQIFALPGSPLDSRANGTNNLIKNGATLVTHAKDVIEALIPLEDYSEIQLNKIKAKQLQESSPQQLSLLSEQATSKPSLIYDSEEMAIRFLHKPQSHSTISENFGNLNESERNRILNALSTTPIDLDSLKQSANVSLSQLYLALVELDLEGKLIRHSDGLVSLNSGNV